MKQIIMYTTSTCPHCVTAKRILNEKGYQFVEKNAQLDPMAKNDMAAHGLMGVPSFIIDGVAITGLDLTKIESLLDYTVEACPHCQKRSRVPKNKGKLKITCRHCNESYVKLT